MVNKIYNKFTNKLSTKIIIHVTLISIFTLVILSIINFYEYKKILVEGKINSTIYHTALIQNSIKSKINEVRNDVRFLATPPPIQGIIRATQNKGFDKIGKSDLETWKSRLTTIFKEMLLAKDKYFQIRYIGTADKGREIVRVQRIVSRIDIVPPKSLQQKSSRKYFQETIKLAPLSVYLSEFNLNKEFGRIEKPFKITLRAAVPIYKERNEVFGIVIINMLYNRIFQDINGDNIAGVDEFILSDSKGQVLLNSNAATNILDKDGNSKLISDYLPREIEDQLVGASKTKVLEDDKYIYIASKLYYNEYEPGQFLGILYKFNKTTLLIPVYQNLELKALVVLVLLLSLILVSYFFTHQLVSPIVKLRRLTDDIQAGRSPDIDEESFQTNDEIAQLTKTLFKLSSEIIQKNYILEFQKKALDASTIVTETDPYGVVTYVNDKFCEISGYSREEIIGKKQNIISSGYHSKDFFDELWETIIAGKIWKGEIKNKAKTGNYYWIDITIVPFKNDKGVIEKFISIQKDITDKKQQMEAKSRFLSTMSHEIRTPLNGILGMISFLRDEKLSKEGKEHLQTIRDSGDTLLYIINDILDYSKMEAGQLSLERITFNPVSVIKDIKVLLTPNIKSKSLTVNISASENFPAWVEGDATRFRQVITNLLGNAIKFTHEGSIDISAKVKKIKGKVYTLQFDVKDSGIGISKSAQGKLFKSFSQADKATTRKYGGTGLGLVICKGICKAMGGNIWVESELGQGATFSFTLQLRKSDEKRKVSEDDSKLLTGDLAKVKPLEILVADDNPINQNVAKIYLQKLGYTPDIVSDGSEVFEAIKKKHYDVIFMDSHMPEMDGHEVTEKLRNVLAPDDQPWIIAFTASADLEEREKCLQSGMNDFISKPVNLKSIAKVLFNVEPDKTNQNFKTIS